MSHVSLCFGGLARLSSGRCLQLLDFAVLCSTSSAPGDFGYTLVSTWSKIDRLGIATFSISVEHRHQIDIPDVKTLQILSLHFLPTLQSIFCIRSAVCCLHFVLTGIRGSNTVYFWLHLFAQHT